MNKPTREEMLECINQINQPQSFILNAIRRLIEQRPKVVTKERFNKMEDSLYYAAKADMLGVVLESILEELGAEVSE